jgi:hypothetical protein
MQTVYHIKKIISFVIAVNHGSIIILPILHTSSGRSWLSTGTTLPWFLELNIEKQTSVFVGFLVVSITKCGISSSLQVTQFHRRAGCFSSLGDPKFADAYSLGQTAAHKTSARHWPYIVHFPILATWDPLEGCEYFRTTTYLRAERELFHAGRTQLLNLYMPARRNLHLAIGRSLLLVHLGYQVTKSLMAHLDLVVLLG